jgi:hypothetical protein
MARRKKIRTKDSWQDTITDLREEIRDLQREITRRENAVAALEALSKDRRPHRKTRVVKVGADAAVAARYVQVTNGDKPKTMPQAVAVVLREVGRPLHIVEIAEELRKRWYPNKSVGDIRGNVSGTLDHRARNKDVFTKPARATYGLLSFNGN